MTGEKKEKQAVLIGAGENSCKTAEMIKDKLSQGVCIIALDGGLAFCAENGIRPDLIVGDFDSLPDRVTEEIIDSVADRIAEEIIDSVADRVMEDLQAMTTEGLSLQVFYLNLKLLNQTYFHHISKNYEIYYIA